MRKTLLTLLMATAVLLTGCSGLSKMKSNSKKIRYQANPDPVEVRDDKVVVNFTASWEGSDIITPHHLETFDQMLRQLVSELFNTDIPFLPNPQSKMCGFCPFSEICQRLPS